MDSPVIPNMRNIFVGRKKELRHLWELFNNCQNSYENQVHVLLNAPGVGKSALLHQFGKILHQQKKGLYIEFQVAKEFSTPNDFNQTIIITLHSQIIRNISFIHN